MRVLQRLLVVLGLIVTVGVVSASPASADVYECNPASESCGTGVTGCFVTFHRTGEHFILMDQLADGHSCVVKYIVNSGSTQYGWNTGGNGTTKDINLDLAENTPIRWWPCIGEYANREVACGSREMHSWA